MAAGRVVPCKPILLWHEAFPSLPAATAAAVLAVVLLLQQLSGEAVCAARVLTMTAMHGSIRGGVLTAAGTVQQQAAGSLSRSSPIVRPLALSIPSRYTPCTYEQNLFCLGAGSAHDSDVNTGTSGDKPEPTPQLVGQTFRVPADSSTAAAASGQLRLARAVFHVVLTASLTRAQPPAADTQVHFTAWLYRAQQHAGNAADGSSDAPFSSSLGYEALDDLDNEQLLHGMRQHPAGAATSPAHASEALVASTPPVTMPASALSADLAAPTTVEFEFPLDEVAWLLQPGGHYFLGIAASGAAPCSVGVSVGPLGCAPGGDCQEQQERQEGGSGGSAGGFCRAPFTGCGSLVVRSGEDGSWSDAEAGSMVAHMDVHYSQQGQ